MPNAPFFKECVQAALTGINELLVPAGFSARKDERQKGAMNRAFVRTPIPWRSEIVDVSYPPSTNFLVWPEIRLNFRVSIHDETGEGSFFDGVNMSFILGRQDLGYRVPGWAILKTRRQRTLVNEISRDLAKALSWFDGFQSIDDCLTRLTAEKTNLGAIKESGAAWDARQVLEAWKIRR